MRISIVQALYGESPGKPLPIAYTIVQLKKLLYERMGGDAKIKEMIQVFYQRILIDQELFPFFASADIPKLIGMEQGFFTIAMVGPIEHSSRSRIGAIHGSGITRHHFTRFCNYLIETLIEFGMSQEDADRVLVRIAMYRACNRRIRDRRSGKVLCSNRSVYHLMVTVLHCDNRIYVGSLSPREPRNRVC